MATSLDSTDEQLIALLQQDGRMTYTRLGKEVGLSEAAVRNRVQRLLDSGVMQVVAVTDPLSLGLRRQAMIAVRVDGDVRRVAEAISTFDEVIYVVITAGPTDLIAEALVANDEALLELVNDRIRKIPGVVSTETTIYLRLAKQTYEWGVR